MIYFEFFMFCFHEHNCCMLGSIFERATQCFPSTSFKHGSFMINTKDENFFSYKYILKYVVKV